MLPGFDIRNLNPSDVLQGDCPFARFCCNHSLANGYIRIVAVGVLDGEGFQCGDVVFIVETVIHEWACGVEKNAGLGKGWGQ
jgi:hypothetical protein